MLLHYLILFIQDIAMRNFLLKSLVQDAGKKFRWLFNLEAMTRSYSTLTGFTNHGKPFAGPTAFLSGSNSRYITYVCLYVCACICVCVCVRDR